MPDSRPRAAADKSLHGLLPVRCVAPTDVPMGWSTTNTICHSDPPSRPSDQAHPGSAVLPAHVGPCFSGAKAALPSPATLSTWPPSPQDALRYKLETHSLRSGPGCSPTSPRTSGRPCPFSDKRLQESGRQVPGSYREQVLSTHGYLLSSFPGTPEFPDHPPRNRPPSHTPSRKPSLT